MIRFADVSFIKEQNNLKIIFIQIAKLLNNVEDEMKSKLKTSCRKKNQDIHTVLVLFTKVILPILSVLHLGMLLISFSECSHET